MHIHVSTVNDSGDFIYFVRELVVDDEFKVGEDLGLEAYLRALWGLILQNRTIAPSWTLFAYLIEEAFFAEPLPFDPAWMGYEQPPSMDEETFIQPFDTLQKLILYQIAVWERMQTSWALHATGVEDAAHVASLSAHPWENFDPFSFLGRAASPWDDTVHLTECDWHELAILLWLGQIYE